MFKRDFLLILTCLGISYIAFQRESWVEFKPNWQTKIQTEEFIVDNDYQASPVVGDLNGDGHFEILVPTKDTKVKVISPPRHPAQTSKIVGLLQAKEIGSIDLQGENILSFTQGLQPVAIKVGYIESPQSMTQSIRKQVVAVVTDGGLLRLYSHQFKLLWESKLFDHIPPHASIREVDIVISNHTIVKGDKGCIIAGISIHNLYSKHNRQQNPFADQEHQNKIREEHAKTHFGAENLTDIGGSTGIDTSTHFQIFAFNGENGKIRWHNKGEDFHRDVANVRDDVLPQQHYKLNAKSMEGRKYGEESCRHYRTSVLASLPHRWRNIDDTALVLSHYKKQNLGSGKDPKRLVQGHKQKSTSYNPHLAIAQADQSASRLQQGFSNFLVNQPNKSPMKNEQSESSNSNKLKSSHFKNLDYQEYKYHEHQYAHNYPHAVMGNPNVVVAHLREGLQVFHMYTGQPICKIYFPPGGYNVDLDGDGILDQINSFGDQYHMDQQYQYLQKVIQEKRRYNQNRYPNDEGQNLFVQPKCVGWVNSGIPPTEHKFNQSICKRGAFNIGSLSFGAALENIEEEENTQDLTVATPVSLPVPIGGKYYRPQLLGQPYQALFLTSQGLLTAFTEDGAFLWQAQLSLNLEQKIQKPYLDVIPLVQGGVPIAIVAGGETFVQILSESGHSLNKINFEEEIVSLKFQDFSGDHLVDIIAVGKNKVYGYIQVRNPSSEPITILILILMGAMVLIYLSQNNQSTLIFQNLGRKIYKLEPKDD